MKKPFFWFLIKEPINNEMFEEFKLKFADNMGLAISDEVPDTMKYQIFEIFRAERHIPLAIYYPVEDQANAVLNPYFTTSIFAFKTLRTLITEPTHISFRNTVALKSKININNILHQLTPYFTYKNMFPNSGSIFELHAFKPSNLNMPFFRLIDKLGIHTYLVPFEMENVTTLQDFFKDVEEEPINEKANDSKEIRHWRKQIDGMDSLIIETLHHRIRLVKEMGEYKKQNKLELFQSDRWQEIIESKIELAKVTNVDEEFLRKIFTAIHLDGLKKMIEMMDDMEFE